MPDCPVILDNRAAAQAVARRAEALFWRTLGERCGEELSRTARCELVFELDGSLPAEGYSLADAGAALRIGGGSPRGLLYGVGKLLHSSGYAPGCFTPSAWRGQSAPVCPVRGMYFATHFHNFYHDAPLAEVERYVEELALWGCNALTVWFDMHHYHGIEDPAAQAMLARLRAILAAANGVGMGAGLATLANEGYANSPEDLRADWMVESGGKRRDIGSYHRELCPAKPGAIELELRWRREILAAFAGIEFEYLSLGPYDQGGCTCAACAPWGANGFLTIGEPVARLFRQHSPKARIILVTWWFGNFYADEWDRFLAVARARPDWFDYLLVEEAGGPVPEILRRPRGENLVPQLSFPEISMAGMTPWGGFGANPRPAHWQRYWQTAKTRIEGSFPYSEGIFEDFNKVMMLQLEWEGERTSRELIGDYALAELGLREADELAAALAILEGHQNHQPTVWSAPVWQDLARQGWAGVGDPVYAAPAIELAAAEAAVAKLAACADAMPGWGRDCWRWRILALRARLDLELARSGNRTTAATEACFAELTAIYHADRAQYHVAPPGRQLLARTFAPRP